MQEFNNVKYAVIDKEANIIAGAGGDGYALYKTLKHANAKAARCGRDRYFVVPIYCGEPLNDY